MDGTKEDNSFGRLVNDDHKKPNCGPKVIHAKGGTPSICFFAVSDIEENTELRYDYGSGDFPWRKKV